MNVTDGEKLKAAIHRLADELAALPKFSKDFQKTVATAKKKYAKTHAYLDYITRPFGDDAATYIVKAAEKRAEMLRQDQAERYASMDRLWAVQQDNRKSHESVQARMSALLAEETPSVIGMPAEQLLKHLKAAEAAADKMVAAFDRLNHGSADEARAQVDSFKKAAATLKQYAADLLKY